MYIYFETTLTSPKVKDLIHGPKQEYKLILESIHKNVDTTCDVPLYSPSVAISTDANAPTLGINTSSRDMKSDLKEYLREIK